MVVFIHEFDVLKGNTLSWTNGNAEALEGLEFTVLPSGIHLRERDTIYFQFNGKSGLAVFRQNSLDLDASQHYIDRSQVKIFSFGTLFDEKMDYEQLSLYEKSMKTALEEWWEDHDYNVLEKWDAKRNHDEISSFNFNDTCVEVGPIVLQLWRCALLHNRVLVLNKGVEVKKCNMLCHLITTMGKLEQSVYDNEMTITMLNTEKYKSSESWCATTSDEILMYETDLYDKLVIWDATGIHLRDHDHEVKCNEVDFSIYKSLTSDDLSKFNYQYESSIIWSKLIIDGLFLIFTGNMYKPWYHVEIEPVENPDFYRYFEERTRDIYSQSKTIIENNPDQDTIYQGASILTTFQLDYFHDAEFLRQLTQQWFGKPIIPNYIDLSFLF